MGPTRPICISGPAVDFATNRHKVGEFNPFTQSSITGDAASSRGTNEDLLLHGVGRPARVRHCGHDFHGNDTADFSGLRAQDREGPNDGVGVHQHKQTGGDKDHLKIFVSHDAAEIWLQKMTRGVAFEYEVLE